VTGFLLGLLFAAGVALLLFGDRTAAARAWSSSASGKLRDLLRDAGVDWRPLTVIAASLLSALLAAAVAVVISALPVLVLACACAGAAVPVAWLSKRREQRRHERERAWPDALRQLADGLEAGLAFPAAVRLVGEAGPTALRADWRAFQARTRASGLGTAIDGLTERDERTAETVALLLRPGLLELPAGGMAPALRELAGVLSERFEARERARSRAASLRTEAAVLALSPIVLLLIVGTASPLYLDAYRTPTGTLVGATGGLVIFGCWLAMRRLGRVPEPRRSGSRS
jgi:tight adherence protein B